MKMRTWCGAALMAGLSAICFAGEEASSLHTIEKSVAAAPTHAATPADPHAARTDTIRDASASLTSDEALRQLIEGNERYIASQMDHPRTAAARRCETFANGQHPIASVLSCADSRVPLELLFDQGIGDLFVIRVAGNVADTDEIGSIEYGAGHLHTPLIVVLGHTQCGAVTAVVQEAKVSQNIAKLVDNIAPAVATARRNLPGAKGETLIMAAIDANVMQAIADLLSHSEEVRELVEEKKVKVVGAVYDIHIGSVRWLGEHPRQAELLKGTLSGQSASHDGLMYSAPAAEHQPRPNAKSVPEHATPASGNSNNAGEKGEKPAHAESADATSSAEHPAMPHESGTLKGMMIPGVFLGGAGLASSVVFHLMKPRKPVVQSEPARTEVTESSRA
jgi:carbonic anhydrase